MLCSKFLVLDSLNLETIILRMYKSLLRWTKSNPLKSVTTVACLAAVPAAGFFYGIKNETIRKLLEKTSLISSTSNAGTDSLFFSGIILAIVLLLPLIIGLISFSFNLFTSKILFPVFNKLLEAIRKVYVRVLKILIRNGMPD
jgi:uncharacterized integral membrane protein